MGIFKTAEKNSNPKHLKEIESFLMEGEQVQDVYSSVVDWVAITPIRIIFVNGSWTNNRKTVSSIPFSKIIAVHLSKGGFMQITKEVVVSISGHDYEVKLLDADNARELYSTIVERIL